MVIYTYRTVSSAGVSGLEFVVVEWMMSTSGSNGEAITVVQLSLKCGEKNC
jgi:hypothetical protein